MSPSVEERLTEIFRQLLQDVLPLHSQVVYNIRQFTLSMVADNIILKWINQELFKRQKKERYNKTRAAYRKTQVLSVAEAQKKNDEKLQKEQEEKRVKERKAAL